MKPKILVVDDDAGILKQMRWALDLEYDVLTSSDEVEARRLFASARPPVVTLDLSLNQDPNDLAGMRLLEQFLGQSRSTRVIVVTGYNDDSSALEAVRLGAFDFYSKPIRLEELKVMIQRAFHIHDLQQRLQEIGLNEEAGFHSLIGKSKAFREITRRIEHIAASDSPVLVSGENGTGKNLVARAIHSQSQRRNHPFIVVNCSAMPEDVMDSELFGHEKGAFAGAYEHKPGKIELADRGTLFLDQIGELAPSLQLKLLRFLEEREILRIGGVERFAVDVRVIAATNRDLEESVNNPVFCKDLYYRLKALPLDLPSLRERKEDILPLAQHLVRRLCREQHKPPLTLSPEAESALLMYAWPGNIRELENLISRAVVLSRHPILKPNDLGFPVNDLSTNVNLKSAKRAIEADFIKKALLKNDGVISRAARDLGISRVNLYELMDRYNILNEEYKISRSTDSR